VEIDPETRHALKTGHNVFQIDHRQIVKLDHNDGVVCILQLRTPPPPRYQVGDHTCNVPNPSSFIQNNR
jgi:hypothetical protein